MSPTLLSICQRAFDADIVTEIDVHRILSRLGDRYYWMVRSIPTESPTDLNMRETLLEKIIIIGQDSKLSYLRTNHH